MFRKTSFSQWSRKYVIIEVHEKHKVIGKLKKKYIYWSLK